MSYLKSSLALALIIAQYSVSAFACDPQTTEAIKSEVTRIIPFALKDWHIAMVQRPPGSKVVAPNYLISFTADGSTWLGAYNADETNCTFQVVAVTRAE